MISAVNRRFGNPNWLAILVPAIVLTTAAVGGYLFGHASFGFRELVIGILGLTSVFLALVLDSRVLRIGYFFWVGTFAIGWRQIWVTQDLRIHPSEVVIWGLFGLIITFQVIRKERLSWAIPFSLTAFLGLGTLGVLTAINRSVRLDVVVAEFKLFLVLIPILAVTFQLVRGPKEWRRSFFILALVSAYVAGLGAAEYYSPAVVSPLQGIMVNENTVDSQQGLARARFSVFGDPITSVMLSMLLFPTISLAFVQAERRTKSLLFAAAGICALGIYIAGGRGPLIGTAMGLIVYVVLNRKRAWLFLAPAAVMLLAPQQFYNNFAALFDLQSRYDTSVLVREDRFLSALEMARTSPLLGHGWGASGWVHSDLTQIAANLGVPALILFLVWYLGTMVRLAVASRNTFAAWPESQEYTRGLLAGLTAGLVSLASEAMIVLPHLIIPLWFLMAMAGRLLELRKSTTTKLGTG